MNLSDFSRLGGKARAANMTAEQRRQSASAAARAGWAKMSPRKRSAEMRRRALMREHARAALRERTTAGVQHHLRRAVALRDGKANA